MQIFVLGMHRSGTSAVTRLITLMGAYFGAQSLALPADRDNPKGFWERRDILVCNRELMRLSGCVWHVPHAWSLARLSPLPAPLFEGMQSIAADLGAHPVAVAKDPRFCLTLPLWLPLTRDPLAVVCARDPREIARSLHLRNGMPLEYALLLWEFYTVHAIRAAHALPKIFVSHAKLMAAPVAETRTLYGALAAADAKGLTLPAESLVRDFIDPGLQRARATDAPIALTPFQETLLAMWRGEAAMESTLEVPPSTLHMLERWGARISGSPL